MAKRTNDVPATERADLVRSEDAAEVPGDRGRRETLLAEVPEEILGEHG